MDVTGALEPDHPRHKLAFYAESPVGPDVRANIKEFIAKLGKLCTWQLGGPKHIDFHEVPDDDSHGDCCVDHVGGCIELYSAYPPGTLPRETERQMLDEATAFLTAVEDLSRTRQLDFEVAYGDEIIGYIKHGAMDEGLSEAFLDEWRRGLGVI